MKKFSKAKKERHRKQRVADMKHLLEDEDYLVHTYEFRNGRKKKHTTEVVSLDTCECCGGDEETIVASGTNEERVLREAMREAGLEYNWRDHERVLD